MAFLLRAHLGCGESFFGSGLNAPVSDCLSAWLSRHHELGTATTKDYLKDRRWWSRMRARYLLSLLMGLGLVACDSRSVTLSHGSPSLQPPSQVSPQTQDLQHPRFSRVQMVNAMDGWGIDENGLLVKTTDGGSSWVEFQLSVGNLGATGANSVWAASFSATAIHVYRSLNGGKTFTSSTLPGGGFSGAVNFASPTTMSSVELGLKPTILSISTTTDGGIRWQKTKIAVSTQFEGGLVDTGLSGEDQEWIDVQSTPRMYHQDLALFFTTDAGQTWEPISTASLPTAGDKSGVAALSRDNVWVSGTEPTPGYVWLFHTLNGGASWQHVELPVPVAFQEDATIVVEPPNFFGPKVGTLPVYVADRSTFILYRTQDGGQTWLPGDAIHLPPGNSPSGQPFFMSVLDENTIWVSNWQTLYRTTDGGGTWSVESRDPLLTAAEELQFVDPNDGWLLSSGTLWRTVNGGSTWQAATAQPDADRNMGSPLATDIACYP